MVRCACGQRIRAYSRRHPHSHMSLVICVCDEHARICTPLSLVPCRKTECAVLGSSAFACSRSIEPRCSQTDICLVSPRHRWDALPSIPNGLHTIRTTWSHIHYTQNMRRFNGLFEMPSTVCVPDVRSVVFAAAVSQMTMVWNVLDILHSPGGNCQRSRPGRAGSTHRSRWDSARTDCVRRSARWTRNCPYLCSDREKIVVIWMCDVCKCMIQMIMNMTDSGARSRTWRTRLGWENAANVCVRVLDEMSVGLPVVVLC